MSRNELEIVFLNGKIIDGSGNPWYKADVGINEGKIVEIGSLEKNKTQKKIDIRDFVVSPGFIDIHTHSDYSPWVTPEADSHIYQGITTDVIGNCGGSAAPMSEFTKEKNKPLAKEYDIKFDWDTFGGYLDKLDALKTSINLVPLVGNATIRMAVMGMENREPTSKELRLMKKHVAEAMKAGAFGLSTGLFYAPSGFAKTEEVIELAKVAAEYKGIYATHMRNEAQQVIEAVKEAIRIGEEGKIPVHISHHKAFGKRNWGKVHETLKLLEEARARGIDVTADVYAWMRNQTGIVAMLPYWAQEGGTDSLIKRLKNKDARQKMKDDMINGIPDWMSLYAELGWDRVMISRSPNTPEYEGKTVSEIAEKKKMDPFELAFDLIIAEEGHVSVIQYSMDEDDVMYVMKHPLTMIASDSSAISPRGYIGKGVNHPRGYGNAIQFLGAYVREKNLMPWEQGIRKLTSFPAQRIGLKNRGLIKEGFAADLVVFDPKLIANNATYLSPQKYPSGVYYVVVNGDLVIYNGKHLGTYPGKILRKR